MPQQEKLLVTPEEDVSGIVGGLKTGFNTRKTYDKEYRKRQLKQLELFVLEKEDDLLNAVNKDLCKPPLESRLMETGYSLSELRGTLSNLDDYMAPQPAEKGIPCLIQFATPYTVAEPHGVVAIFGAWNYPIQLVLLPLIGAIAAGNAVLIKPSELAVSVSNVFKTQLPKYLDSECVQVVTGGVEVGKKILEQRFDHIFYTGSTRVGRIVMEAAAKHLTTVTLELGGKSPTIVMDDTNVDVAAKRVMWAKCANAGQTCIAPDYILCHSKVKDRFVEGARKALGKFYKDGIETSADYGRIVNSTQFDRLSGLLSSTRGEVLFGGEMDREKKFMSPTVVSVKGDDPLMESEIFGPILPIITINSIDEAVDFIRAREKPLALYLFTESKRNRDQVTTYTSSGGICFNDLVYHAAVWSLPFGGVGHSGMGSYHGKHSFATFSHIKPCLKTSTASEIVTGGRYPPYTAMDATITRIMMTPRKLGIWKHVFYFIGFAALFWVLRQYGIIQLF